MNEQSRNHFKNIESTNTLKWKVEETKSTTKKKKHPTHTVIVNEWAAFPPIMWPWRNRLLRCVTSGQGARPTQSATAEPKGRFFCPGHFYGGRRQPCDQGDAVHEEVRSVCSRPRPSAPRWPVLSRSVLEERVCVINPGQPWRVPAGTCYKLHHNQHYRSLSIVIIIVVIIIVISSSTVIVIVIVIVCVPR